MPRKVMLLVLLGLLTWVSVALHADAVLAFSPAQTVPAWQNGSYRETLADWEADGYAGNADVAVTVAPSAFQGGAAAAFSHGYHHEARSWDEFDQITLAITVPSTGLYRFYLDFYPLDEDYLNYELELWIDGELPFAEAAQIILYKHWQAGDTFAVDRFGNDFFVEQSLALKWYRQGFMDPMGFHVEPLSFRLEAGENLITLKRKQGNFLLGDVLARGIASLPTYAEYREQGDVIANQSLYTVEAETPHVKNSSSIQAGVSRDLGVTPFDVSLLKLNILAGSTFASERDTVYYHVDVAQSGYYFLSFKVRQAEVTNAAVFRTLMINGEVPFQEAAALRIPYSHRWFNYTPADAAGNAYLFYLESGRNEISLSVNLAVYRDTYQTVREVLTTVNQLALDIRKLTGNQVDEDRDWEITDYLPTIGTDQLALAARLEAEQEYLAANNGSRKASAAESHLALCIRHLRLLAQKPNEIPKNITMLATSPASVAALLGIIQGVLVYSPLDIDKFYVHTETELPRANAGFLPSIWLAIRRFFRSFFEERYSVKADPDELEVWVNRSKQYVDLIQKLADEKFTNASGIKVRISVMSAEGKLILANSAKQNPDVALGIASWMPYDLGIRGALYDLSQFADDADFATTLALYNPEALVPMVYAEGLYGLPDTQNFYVLFYRKDILSTLDIQIPDTWQEVTEILPVLKRYGMNFYIPLSSATSLKAFDSTLPFLFQHGSEVYRGDGFATAIDDAGSVEALTMMTELYTIYSMDVTVSSFYNDFRLGNCPIGVGDFGMYVTLLNAAPDIQGLWGIAPLPGVDKNGEIDRSAPGAATANVIFRNTEKAAESWAFLKWWATTATQIDFSRLLLSTLGREYLWNSANVAAFNASGFAAADLSVIGEQWEWLRELPKVPGSYQVELEISNLWNKVVIDRKNLRVELYDAVIRADREIRKKMSEFGYLDKQGNVLKPYALAARAYVERLLGGDAE